MANNQRLLSIALVAFGLVFCLLYPLSMIWPSGWAWHDGSPASSDYFMMIVGIYATLGVFLILAARNPQANRSLIWFVVWSSVVHAIVMAWESMRNPAMGGHLMGDVPALLIAALVLGVLLARGAENRSRVTV